MKPKLFKSKFSDMKVEVYKSGFIALTDAEDKTIVLGEPPNARINLILEAIEYVKKNKGKLKEKNET